MGERQGDGREGFASARFARKLAVRNCLRAVVFAGAFGVAWLIGASGASADEGTGPSADGMWTSEFGVAQAWQDVGSPVGLVPRSCPAGVTGSGEVSGDDNLVAGLSAPLVGLGLLDLPLSGANERDSPDVLGLTAITCSARPVTAAVTATLADVPAVLTRTASNTGVGPLLTQVPHSLDALVPILAPRSPSGPPSALLSPSSGTQPALPRPPSGTQPALAGPSVVLGVGEDHSASYDERPARADRDHRNGSAPAPERPTPAPVPVPLFGVTGWGLANGITGGSHPVSSDGLVGGLPADRFPEPPPSRLPHSTERAVATGIPAAEPVVSPD